MERKNKYNRDEEDNTSYDEASDKIFIPKTFNNIINRKTSYTGTKEQEKEQRTNSSISDFQFSCPKYQKNLLGKKKNLRNAMGI